MVAYVTSRGDNHHLARLLIGLCILSSKKQHDPPRDDRGGILRI